MTQTSWRDTVVGLTASCFASLSDDDAALLARAGGGNANAPAMLDYRDIEVPLANGALVVERRPVVTLPSSVAPVPRGSSITVNGKALTSAFVLSDNGDVLEVVCDG